MSKVSSSRQHTALLGVRVFLPLIMLLAVALLVVTNLPRLEQTLVRGIITYLERHYGVEVRYERLEGDIRRQLEFCALTAKLPSGDSIVCTRVAVGFDLGQLLRRRYRITSLAIDSPRVYLARSRQEPVCENRDATVFAAKTGGVPIFPREKITIDQARVVNGSVFDNGRVGSVRLLAASIDLGLSFALDSNGASIRLDEGRAFVPDAGIRVRSLTGKMALQGARLRGESLALRTDRSRARFDLQGDLDARTLALDLEMANLELSELAAIPALTRFAPTGRMNASGRLSVRLGDSVPDLAGELTVSAQALAFCENRDATVFAAKTGSVPIFQKSPWADFRLSSVAGKLSIQGSKLNVNLDLRDSVYGEAALTGELDWRRLDYTLAASLSGLRVTQLPNIQWPVASDEWRMTGRLNVEGEQFRRVAFGLQARLAGMPFDTISLQGRYENQSVWIEGLEARRASNSGAGAQRLLAATVRVAGEFGRTSLNAHAEVADLSLDLFRPWIKSDLTAVISGQIQASGSYESPTLAGKLWAGSGQIAGCRFDSLGAEFDVPGLRLNEGTIQAVAWHLAWGRTSLERAQVSVNRTSFSAAIALDRDIHLATHGAWTNGREFRAVCSSFTVQNRHELAATQHPFEVCLSRDRMSVLGFEADAAGGQLRLDLASRRVASTPGDDPELTLEAHNLDLRRLGEFLGLHDSLSGHLDITVKGEGRRATGEGQREEGRTYTANVRATDLSFAGFNVRADQIFGRLSFSRKELIVDDLKLVHAGDTSSVAGSVSYRSERGFAIQNLNLHAQLINPGVWVLAPLLKSAVDVRQGNIYADLQLTGSPFEPLLDGTAHLYKAELFIPSIGQGINDVTGEFSCVRNVIGITELTGRSGDGSASATGRIVLEYLRRVKDLSLSIRVRSVEFHPLPEVVAIAGGEIDLHWGTAQPLSIAGTAVVEEALITTELGSAARTVTARSSGDSLRLELRVTAERKVWLRNRMADLELKGDITIRNSDRGLAVIGELETRQGRVYAFDHSFRVTRGRLQFDNPDAIDPGLDIVAELPLRTRDTSGQASQAQKILATLSGTTSQPVVTLSSDPAGMSETDITYYLATNITPEELSFRDDRGTFNRLVSDRLLSFASRELSTRLQRYLDLDVLELQAPSLSDPQGVKITVGKYVGKNLFLSYTANTGQLAPDAFKAEYFVNSAQEVIGERTETGEYNLRWQFKLRY